MVYLFCKVMPKALFHFSYIKCVTLMCLNQQSLFTFPSCREENFSTVEHAFITAVILVPETHTAH